VQQRAQRRFAVFGAGEVGKIDGDGIVDRFDRALETAMPISIEVIVLAMDCERNRSRSVRAY
jgi:hypothetical protein